MIKLEELVSPLQQQGYNTQLHSTESVPFISVNFAAEGADSRVLYIKPSPIPSEMGLHTQFVWFELNFPFMPSEQQQVPLLHALAIVNDELELGRFNLNANQQLSYRYMWSVAAHTELDIDHFLELLALIEFEQEHFSVYLEGVCGAEISHLILRTLIQQTND